MSLKACHTELEVVSYALDFDMYAGLRELQSVVRDHELAKKLCKEYNTFYHMHGTMMPPCVDLVKHDNTVLHAVFDMFKSKLGLEHSFTPRVTFYDAIRTVAKTYY